jgi:hypothetical protein
MDEHVFAPALGLNESLALRRVEPFDSASRHHRLLECANMITTHGHRAIARPTALSCGSPQWDAQQAMLRAGIRPPVGRGIRGLRTPDRGGCGRLPSQKRSPHAVECGAATVIRILHQGIGCGFRCSEIGSLSAAIGATRPQGVCRIYRTQFAGRRGQRCECEPRRARERWRSRTGRACRNPPAEGRRTTGRRGAKYDRLGHEPRENACGLLSEYSSVHAATGMLKRFWGS